MPVGSTVNGELHGDGITLRSTFTLRDTDNLEHLLDGGEGAASARHVEDNRTGHVRPGETGYLNLNVLGIVGSRERDTRVGGHGYRGLARHVLGPVEHPQSSQHVVTVVTTATVRVGVR